VVPFSCFALPDSFSTVLRASYLVFMLCDRGPIFGSTEGVGSGFHVLRSRTRFRRCRRRRVPFITFALLDSFSAVPRASGPVFMVCAPRPVFSGTDGAGSRFYVLRSRIQFRRYRGRRVQFSCFALPDPFLAVPTASVLVFMLRALGPILGGTEGVGARFHVLRSRTHFWRYRGRCVSFSCFALPDPFSAVTRRRVPFSCLALLASFSAVPRASYADFMFRAPRLDFGGTEGVGFLFHVLRTRTRFRRYGVGSRFHVFPSRSHFRRYRGQWVSFSCFALSDPFSAVPTASGPVFMFCDPRPIFGGTDGVGSLFHVFRPQIGFRLYRRRWVSFLCFALPDTFFVSPELVEFCFHVLRSRTHFRRY
jgi:hypothetical protein